VVAILRAPPSLVRQEDFMRSQGTSKLRGSVLVFAKRLGLAALPLLLSCAHASEPSTRAGTGGGAALINPIPEAGPPLLGGGDDGGIPGIPWQYAGSDGTSAFKDPTLPANAKDLFGGPPSTSGQPVIVYPLTGSMHAMNQGDITFQWNAGVTTNNLFRLQVTAGADKKKFEFYLPCTDKMGQCTYQMPALEWLDLGDKFRGQDLTFTIVGTDGKSSADGGPAGVVYTSKSITISFSPEPVIGGLYYWAAASKSIKRFTFGAKKAVPFITPNSKTDEFSCVACHSVSRNGKVIAFAVSQDPGGENTSAIQTAPTDDPTMPYIKPAKGMTPYYSGPDDLAHNNKIGPMDHFGHNVALSPDGSLSAINGIAPPPTTSGWPLNFEIRDTMGGMTLGHWDQGDPLFGDNKIPIFPEWSPDGTTIVATMSEFQNNNGCAFWTQSTCTGSIVTMTWTPTDPMNPTMGGTLGQAHVLVAANSTGYHFYPSWSPDGKWIVFVSAPAQNVSSLSNPKAVLRIVSSTGGPYTCPSTQCFDLVNGTQYKWADSIAGNGKHSTWPKFSPFAQGPNKNLFFISFTSGIPYGYLANADMPTKPQLWSFFVDTTKLDFGKGDASYAPVWLPYQDINDGAISPYWTETLPCTVDGANNCIGCVQGEECEVDKTKGSCQCVTPRIQ
jgi:hypothetical protein